MKHTSVIVPQGSAVVDTVIGSYNLLKMANGFLKRSKGLHETPYKIELVGLNKEPVTYDRLIQMKKALTKLIKPILL